MYDPEGLALQIFQERYAAHAEETWDEACHRVAAWAASAEDRDNVASTHEEFYRILRQGLFMPGGRIWYGAGRVYAQGINCFVLGVDDSRESIGQLFHDTMVVSGTGGGIGVNFSNLRGQGFPIHGMGGKSTGAVSFMKAQNAIGEQIVAGGSRRTALMQCLNINHPDIEEFITTKLDRQELDNANVSVVIPHDLKTTTFIAAVRGDKGLPLMFGGGETGKSVSARDLWERVVSHAWESGEPGVLNAYCANRMSNMRYKYVLSSTNPCGEQWLPTYGSCNLGALVLPRFVSAGYINYQKLAETIKIAVRFLDNVLTVNQYPLAAIKNVSQGERRIGLGVMGLHSMLLDLGLRYSSATSEVEEIMEYITDRAYISSVKLAQERGPFPHYDRNGFAQSVFTKDRQLDEFIKLNGIRNCALTTVAPTGTTSMVQGVTSGVEPMFSPVYFRRRYVEGDYTGHKVLEKVLVISKDYTDHMDVAEGAYDVSPEQHFAMQKAVQRTIDSAVSKTINLPRDYPAHKLSDVWLDNLPYLKGSTLYREGSRGNEPLEYVPLNEVADTLFEWKGQIENEDGTTTIDSCITGMCDV